MELDLSEMMKDVRRIVEQEKERADEIVESMAKSAHQKIVQKAPVKMTPYTGKRSYRVPGDYKRGWEVESKYSVGQKCWIVKNDKEPKLVHLLESGTGWRQTKKGANRGRVIARPHIRPAFDETVIQYEKKI